MPEPVGFSWAALGAVVIAALLAGVAHALIHPERRSPHAPDGLDVVLAWLALAADHLLPRRGHAAEVESWLRTPDGRACWVRFVSRRQASAPPPELRVRIAADARPLLAGLENAQTAVTALEEASHGS